MTIEQQTINQVNPSGEANTVSIDNFWDCIQFVHNGEELVFKRIPNHYGREGMAFAVFRNDGTQLGISFCRVDRFQGKAWYLDDVQTFSEFERKGYGTQLLEQTCEALWRRNLKDIVLERPGNSISPDGFDRKLWYEKHGFEPHPNPEITFMWRKAPSNSSTTAY